MGGAAEDTLGDVVICGGAEFISEEDATAEPGADSETLGAAETQDDAESLVRGMDAES